MSSFPLISKGTETLSCQRFLSYRLSSTFQAEQEQAFSASHFPLQRALNLGMEKIFFFILSSAVGEQSTSCSRLRKGHADFLYTVLYQRAERKVGSRLERIQSPMKRTLVTVTPKAFKKKL